jgi:hypothetical protein
MDAERVLFHYGNHPIKWVRLTGVIVAVDEYPGKNVYTLDDSSGMCIECVCVAPTPPPKTEVPGIPTHLNQIALLNQAANSNSKTTRKEEGQAIGTAVKEKATPSVQEPNVPWEEMDVGVVVKVKGRVGDFWNQKQIEVVKIEVLRSTDAEVKCWNEVMDFRRDVLGKVWVVSVVEEEKCRRARERELSHARKGNRGKEKDKTSKKEELSRNERREDARKKRKELEREGEDAKRRKEKDDALKAKNKVNYPSLAVRRAAAGKYDALGI